MYWCVFPIKFLYILVIPQYKLYLVVYFIENASYIISLTYCFHCSVFIVADEPKTTQPTTTVSLIPPLCLYIHRQHAADHTMQTTKPRNPLLNQHLSVLVLATVIGLTTVFAKPLDREAIDPLQLSTFKGYHYDYSLGNNGVYK